MSANKFHKLREFLNCEDIKGFGDELLQYLRATKNIKPEFGTSEREYLTALIPWGFRDIEFNLKITHEDLEQFIRIFDQYLTKKQHTSQYKYLPEEIDDLTIIHTYKHNDILLKTESQEFIDFLESLPVPTEFRSVPGTVSVTDAIKFFIRSIARETVSEDEPMISVSACLEMLRKKMDDNLWAEFVKDKLSDIKIDRCEYYHVVNKREYASKETKHSPIEQYIVIRPDLALSLKEIFHSSTSLLSVINKSFKGLTGAVEFKKILLENEAHKALLPRLKNACHGSVAFSDLSEQEREYCRLLVERHLLSNLPNGLFIASKGVNEYTFDGVGYETPSMKITRLVSGWLNSNVSLT